MMENTWILALVVFLTQVVFIWSRTWNINAIAEKNIKTVLISGAIIHWAWLLSIAIGAFSMREILIDFEWVDVPVVLGSTIGGLYGSWLGMKQKIAKDLKMKLKFRQAGQKAVVSEIEQKYHDNPLTENDSLVKAKEDFTKIAFNYEKNKFFWPQNDDKYLDRIQQMFFQPKHWLNVQNNTPTNIPYNLTGIGFKEMILMVDQFHHQFNLKMEDTGHLNYDLMTEELKEYRDAVIENDRTGKLDAVTDMLYILLGIIRKENFQNVIELAFAEVHSSNLSKADNDGKPIYRHDGKLLKGPNYKEPRLAEIASLLNY